MNELRCYMPVSCKQSSSSTYQLLLHSTWLYTDPKRILNNVDHDATQSIYNICQSLHHLPVHPLFSINGFDLRIICSGYWNNQDTHSHDFFVHLVWSWLIHSYSTQILIVQFTELQLTEKSTHKEQFPFHQTNIWQPWFFYNISSHFNRLASFSSKSYLQTFIKDLMDIFHSP